MTNTGEELFKDVAGSFLGESIGLVDKTEELSVLGYFHYVVHNSIYFSIDSSVYSADIEVDDLDYVFMFSL